MERHKRRTRRSSGNRLLSCALPLAAIVFFLESVLRVASIDRGTPGLGLVIHAFLMLALFMVFSLPVGATLGALSCWSERRFAARSFGSMVALATAAILAAIAAGTFVNLGRQSPAWHVTTAVVLWTALLAAKLFFVGHRFAAAWFAREKSG